MDQIQWLLALVLAILTVFMEKSNGTISAITNIDDTIMINDIQMEELKIRDPHPDADLNVTELLKKYGYPSETHEVVTKDGYILTIHRIPHGRNDSKNNSQSDIHQKEQSKPVVFLQHGLLCSSADWLMNTVDKALGYQLADIGYDVWLLNARGNTYSRRHVSLSPKDSAFWDFSFHQMGEIDIPAVINYVLNVTSEKKLFYIGHSMGTTMFWIAMSTHPEYKEKIKGMFALGPIAYLIHTKSPVRVFSPFAMDLEKAGAIFGERDFLPNGAVIRLLQKTVCDEKYLREAICENVMFLICGFDRPQLNESMVPVILGHTPSGTSTKVVIHYLQIMNSGKFRQFDYGTDKNLEIYGSLEPPAYNLSQVNVPVGLYWGQNDWLSVKEDIYKINQELPNVFENYRINLRSFNHLDFLYAVDSNKLLYNRLINKLKHF